MSKDMEKQEYNIDATNRRLGHLAVEVADILNGKNKTDYAKNVLPNVVVKISNVSKMDIPERKKTETYESYSGYPSGRKVERLDHLANRLGYGEVLKKSIRNMLPKNRLQKQKMLNIEITE